MLEAIAIRLEAVEVTDYHPQIAPASDVYVARCLQHLAWPLNGAFGTQDLVTFNSAINACGKAACWQHALSLLNQLGVRTEPMN